jgi:DNA-binding NarL/FixJ family response regulator
MQGPIRLILADQHLLFRQGLRSLLASHPDVTVVGETDHVDELVPLLQRTPCDLLLVDLEAQPAESAEVQLLSRRVPVVVLTGSERTIDTIAAVRQGAQGVVFKRFGIEILLDAIRVVAGGGVWLPPKIQAHLIEEMRSPAFHALSRREEEIVGHVASGLRNSEIATRLAISEDTVRSHLSSIFRKVGARDRVSLVLHATRAQR